MKPARPRLNWPLALIAGATWLAPALAWANHPPAFNPVDPAKLDYKLVFDDEFNTTKTIDLTDSRDPGFNWYLGQFFGHATTVARDISVNHGILTLNAPTYAQVSTAAPLHAGTGWVGKTFGGGFYIEARIAYLPSATELPDGHPSFWSMAIEHMQGKPPGSFEHFIEDDFFEDDTAYFAGPDSYGGALHDWYGLYRRSCPSRPFCDLSNDGHSAFDNAVIRMQPRTDFTKFHVFGQLWQPASAGHAGFVQYYFDNKPTHDRVTWPHSGPASLAPFAVIDHDHLVIILDTGDNHPMQVDWVRLWQISTASDHSSP